MSIKKRHFTSAFSLFILGCAGSAPWEEVCGCSPAWMSVAWQLEMPQPVTEDMLEPASVSRALWKNLNEQPKPATLAAIQSMNESFAQSCQQQLATIRCTFWLWRREGEERGLEIQIPVDETATQLPLESVFTKVMIR